MWMILLWTHLTYPNWWAECHSVPLNGLHSRSVWGVYIHWRVPGASGASTAGLLSALCFGLHSLVVLDTERSHTDRGVHVNTKSAHTSYLYCSMVDLHRGKTGWYSIVRYTCQTLLGIDGLIFSLNKVSMNIKLAFISSLFLALLKFHNVFDKLKCLKWKGRNEKSELSLCLF